LNFLKIDYSKLETLEIGAFVGAGKLEKLLFFETRLKALKRIMFLPLRALTELQISNSEIDHLEDELFFENGNLRIVVFSGNKLKTLTELTFAKSQLNFLDLDNNNLPEFVKLSTKKLSISNNYLTEIWIVKNYLVITAILNLIQRVLCDESSSLQEFYLQNNRMSEFGCISELEKLKILDLSYNNLANLTSRNFQNLNYLKLLGLVGNQLFNFDIQWLKYMNCLKNLQVDGLLDYSNISKTLINLESLSISPKTLQSEVIRKTLADQGLELN
jgi:Leucine-rich repeat (LRR) protein